MDMKDIMLKITGRQYNGDKPLDKMEFVTEGKMYERNGATYLVYDESEFSGFPGCKTSLKLQGSRVRMKRIGEDLGDGTVMEFESGKRFRSSYETPYGEMDMEILTDRVENNIDENGNGNVDIDYHVSLEGELEGRNELRIEVSESKPSEHQAS